MGLIALDEAIVGAIVDAAEGNGRAHVIALGGVVINHVEDDLDAGLVEGADHGLELGDHLARLLGKGIVMVWGEKAEGVIAPVVAQPQVAQAIVLQELVDGHELNGGNAKLFEVVNDGRVGHAGIRAAQLFWYVRVGHGHALNVGFVNDLFIIGNMGAVVATPVKEGIDDHRQHGVAQRVLFVAAGAGFLGVDVIGIQGGIAVEFAVEGSGIRIDKELGRVAAQAVFWFIRAIDAVAVALARGDIGEVDMPHMGGNLRHFDAFLIAFFVNEAELNLVCYLGKQGKVGAGSIKGGSQRGGFARPNLAAVALGGRGDCVHGGSVHAHEHNHFLVASAVRKSSVNNAYAP